MTGEVQSRALKKYKNVWEDSVFDICFVIPVRHHLDAKDWNLTCRLLRETAKSIAGQTNNNWHAVVVANDGANLPELPKGFSICRVDFPPNQMHDMSKFDKKVAREAFRYDKGRRVLAGIKSAPNCRYFMTVDDDDLVSSLLVDFVSKSKDCSGWKIQTGYGWTEGSNYLVLIDNFSGLCGSSLIVNKNLLLDIPKQENKRLDFIKDYLGSHLRIKNRLKQRGLELGQVPFPGAIYRLGHANAHSKSGAMLKYFFFSPKYLLNPKQILRNLLGIRKLSENLKQEYFG